MLKTAVDVADTLAEDGVSVRVLSMHTLKPLDEDALLAAARETGGIVTLEEHSIVGGLGSALAEVVAEAGFDPGKRFARIGVPDVFPDEYESQESSMRHHGIMTERVVAVTRSLLATSFRSAHELQGSRPAERG